MKHPNFVQSLQTIHRQNPTRIYSGLASTVCVGLILMSLFNFIADFRQLNTVSSSLQNAQPSTPPISKTHRPGAIDPKQITQVHLFGKVGENAAIVVENAPETPIDAPTTSLELELKGVYTSELDGSGSAIITGPDKTDKYYLEGSTLPGPAKLKNVYHDRVLLEHKGQLETLWLYEEEPQTLKNKSRQSSPKTSPGAKLVDKRKNQQVASILSKYQEKAVNEPMALLNVIRARPARVNGKITGVRISPGKERADFVRIGLKTNDIITAINGVSLADAQDGSALFDELKGASEFSLMVNRGNQQLNILYSTEAQ